MPKGNDAPTIEQLDNLLAEEPHETVAEMLREEWGRADEGSEASEPSEPTQPTEPEVGAAGDEGGDPDGGKVDGEGDGEGDPEKAAENGEKGEGAEEDAIEPPAAWTAEEHATFRKLEPEAQKWVLSRVSKADEGLREAQETAKRYEALESVIAPYRDAWARDGMTEDQAIRQLTALSNYAAQSPTEFVQWFAQQRGVDISALARAAAGGQPQPEVAEDYQDDPAYQTLMRRIEDQNRQIEQLGGTVQQVAGTFAERQREEQTRFDHEVNAKIQAFSGETDESGGLKHPYFEQVKQEMGVYLSEGLATTLEDAYTRACRANPDVWAKIEQSRKATEDRERAKQSREKAVAAKKSGSSVTGQPGARAEPSFTGDLHEDLRAEFANRGLVG
ncbi:MAG TPA: hypothetical protein VKA19_04420 [Alphaproteobacteria bacterium]|nr:hypothetical protein [Alphaproteobacteria bacterium]